MDNVADMHSSTIRHALTVTICLLATSCDGAADLSWEIVFADATLADRAVLVEGRILSGGCGGTELHRATATRASSPDMPSVLDPGTYGFAGRASDDECVWFAAGCVEITLPGDGTELTVTLEADTESPSCTPAECDAGVCASDMDAGPQDAGRDDAGSDAGFDAGTDAGEVIDGGCGGTCGECEVCVAAGCVAATDGTTCSTGSCVSGACCAGCAVGGACATGNDDTACGSGGNPCQVCACPLDRCDTGSCVLGRPIDTFTMAESTTCASTSGQLFCWGNNDFGQLARGTMGAGTEVLSPTAASTTVMFTGMGAGDDHLLGVASGALYSWGENMDGALGHGDLATLTTATRVGSLTTWTRADGTLSGDATCAMRGTDELLCAGQNDYGQLGLGDIVARTTLTAVAGAWRTFDLGHYHGCAIQTDGSLHCWGRNRFGQLGQGDIGAATTRTSPTRVGTANDWTAVAGGEFFTCALKGAGELWCWGDNDHAQVGRTASSGVQTPMRVGTDTDWAQISAGQDHACALKTGGTVWCWGQNSVGQLGRGVAGADVSAPIQVGTATDWTAVRATGDFTCATTTANALLCWGENGIGQLGLGDRTDRLEPTPICW